MGLLIGALTLSSLLLPIRLGSISLVISFYKVLDEIFYNDIFKVPNETIYLLLGLC